MYMEKNKDTGSVLMLFTDKWRDWEEKANPPKSLEFMIRFNLCIYIKLYVYFIERDRWKNKKKTKGGINICLKKYIAHWNPLLPVKRPPARSWLSVLLFLHVILGKLPSLPVPLSIKRWQGSTWSWRVSPPLASSDASASLITRF